MKTSKEKVDWWKIFIGGWGMWFSGVMIGVSITIHDPNYLIVGLSLAGISLLLIPEPKKVTKNGV